MTCRQNLLVGLIAALSLSPDSARISRAANQQGASVVATDETVPDIALRRGPITASGAPSSWKPSQTNAGADVRFKRPAIVAVPNPGIVQPSSQSTPVGNMNSKPAQLAAPAGKPIYISDTSPETPASQQPARSQTTPSVVFAKPRATTPQPAAQPTATSQLNASGIAPANTSAANPQPVTQAVAEQVASLFQQPTTNKSQLPQSTTIAPAAAQPTAGPTADQYPRTQTRLTDEQLQLVSRILQDSQVIGAAEEEALPPSPGDAQGNTSDSAKRGTVPNLDGEMGYYGDCCPPRPCLFWTAGFEATFLNPDLNSNGVNIDVEEIDENRHDICSTLSNDVDSIYVSPRMWIGVQGCCWGANLRYWHLQASEGAYDPSIGGLGTWNGYDCGVPDFGFNTCSRLEAYTIDLELTRRFCINECAMQAAVGLRHANLENNESIWALANTDEGLLTGMARANRLSRGTGIMLGLYGRKPVFPCSCVHWFYNARWSALWGPTQTSAETFASVQTIADPDISGSAASVNGAYTSVDDTMFIGEIQLGLEWLYSLQCVPANAFFRAAIEYQRWDGGSGFSRSQSFAGATIIQEVDPTSILTANAAAGGPQMDLFGISLGTGLTW